MQQKEFEDVLLTEYTDPGFRQAFQEYFTELGIRVTDWSGLWKEMDEAGENFTLLRQWEGKVIGFCLASPIEFSSWFFTEKRGFIREFWVKKEHRGKGHGAALLAQVEEQFRNCGIHTMILTTDSAPGFYIRHGYEKMPDCQAKNGDDVFVKKLE